MPIRIKPVTDLVEVDTIFESDEDEEGKSIIRLDLNENYIELNNVMRYGTMWTGESPEFVDEEGNRIIISGVHLDTEYFIEVSGYYVRVWERCA